MSDASQYMAQNPRPAAGAGTRDALDGMLPLAHSLHSTPSSHVLLMGAGASIASSMPSAWAVQVDLIRDIARQRGHEFDQIPEAEPGKAEVRWYTRTFEEEPTYQALLGRIGLTPTERQRALRKYFEPRPDGADGGSRKPSTGHRAVADLVRSGHLRIIVTLNFDTLIEQSLRDVGLEPTVVSSPSGIAGMAPLHTHDALVIHLHGHYLLPDTMRNTFDELAEYSPGETRLLRQLFSDYGLIAVGWSAQHDTALRSAIEGTACAHFASYWIEPGTLGEVAENLRAARRMTLLGTDADSALRALRDAVTALEYADTDRHPSTPAVVVATAKRHLSSTAVPIALHDRLSREVSQVRTLDGLDAAAHGTLPDSQYEVMLRKLEAAAATSTALVATMAFWGSEQTDQWLVAEVERSLRPVRAGGTTRILRLPHVPGFLWATTAAVAAVASQRWSLFRRLMNDTTIKFFGDREQPLATGLTAASMYLDRPLSYPFDLLEDVFLVHLGLSKAAWLDAWETVEILRIAIDLNSRHGAQVDGALGSLERARQLGREHYGEALVNAIDWLRQLVSVGRPHIRVQDHRADDMYWPVTGSRVHQSLDVLGDSHPMAQASVLGHGSLRHYIVLAAVNDAIARVGDGVAWRSASRGGPLAATIPDYIWLDTGDRPERDH